MARLVPLVATGTVTFVDDLRRAWDDGDAVLPVDPRLPRPAADRLLAALGAGEPVETGDALVVATSGTTGEPKGAVLTHDAVAASAWATSARLAVDPGLDTWLACLPLAHVGGLGVVARALVTGTPLVVHDGFDAAAVQAAADRGEATLVSLVPTALGRLLDPARFRRIVLGGSTPPPGRPANAVATYGLTESGSGVVYDGFPLAGVDVAVRPGPAGDNEVHLRGPMLLRAYRDGTDPKDAGGWFPTGDLGSVDPGTGELTVFGRAADLIVTGGEKVWPAAVEAVLAGVPGVREVAVVGRPDPEWGQRVVAVVVPDDSGRRPSLDRLRAAAKEALGPWAAPREVEYADGLPRTALGKRRRPASRPQTG
ncbi:MAG: class I adenylate-forming enzyme family protein [Acidimicrobiia bacterium]